MVCSPLLMQLEIGMSMSRYFPATGTAGLERARVSGYSRVPRPPPRIRARTERMEESLGKGGPRPGEGRMRRCYHPGHGVGSREERGGPIPSEPEASATAHADHRRCFRFAKKHVTFGLTSGRPSRVKYTDDHVRAAGPGGVPLPSERNHR